MKDNKEHQSASVEEVAKEYLRESWLAPYYEITTEDITEIMVGFAQEWMKEHTEPTIPVREPKPTSFDEWWKEVNEIRNPTAMEEIAARSAWIKAEEKHRLEAEALIAKWEKEKYQHHAEKQYPKQHRLGKCIDDIKELINPKQ
jgi:hypothetical protein